MKQLNSFSFYKAAFALSLVLGMAIRLVCLPLPGTTDMDYFRGWGLAAVDLGATRLYSATDDSLALRKICSSLSLCPPVAEAPAAVASTPKVDAFGQPYLLYVMYPPLATLSFGLTAWMYRLIPLGMRTIGWHNALVKLPVVLAELVTALAVYGYIKKRWDVRYGWAVFAAYWLNPVIIISGACLGYQDATYIVLSFLALLWALEGKAIRTGVAWTLAMMLKQLALFYLPVLVIILFMTADHRKLLGGVLSVVGTALLILFPFIVDGRLIGLFVHLYTDSLHNVLSGTAINIWWIVTFVNEVSMRLAHGATVLQAITQENLLLDSSGSPARAVGIVLYGLLTCLNLYLLLKRRRAGDAFFAVAMQFYGYAMLMVGVHENHLLGAVIFLAVLMFDREQRLLYALISFIVLLNLALFYGIGLGPRIPRLATGIDVTVLAAILNVAVFVWACSLLVRGLPYSSQMAEKITLSPDSVVALLRAKLSVGGSHGIQSA